MSESNSFSDLLETALQSLESITKHHKFVSEHPDLAIQIDDDILNLKLWQDEIYKECRGVKELEYLPSEKDIQELEDWSLEGRVLQVKRLVKSCLTAITENVDAIKHGYTKATLEPSDTESVVGRDRDFQLELESMINHVNGTVNILSDQTFSVITLLEQLRGKGLAVEAAEKLAQFELSTQPSKVIMPTEYELPPAFYDVGWDRISEREDRGGLDFSQVPNRANWVVKLKFEQEGKVNYGTGFYINIPDAEKHVILTAGHNLIDTNGNESQNLVIQTSKGESPIPPESRKISASYRQMPSQDNAVNDYGAILIPKRGNPQRCGFGFSLRLGLDDIRKVDLDVSGYLVGSKAGKPDTSTGKCISCRKDQLEYDVQTDKELSGSPVFMPYKGHDTAVAIHNNGPARHRRGSRGTRLNETVLETIFDWVGVGYKNKSLKAFLPPNVPSKDLYLRFLPEPDQPNAWVRVGSEGLDTRFDILPAYAPTSALDNSPLYAFRFRFPPA